MLAAAALLCYGGTTLLRLGFSCDDWTILSQMHFAEPGFWSSLAALRQKSGMLFFRPFDFVIYAGLYSAFGLHSLPWILALMAVNAGLAYAVFRLLVSFHIDRPLAVLGAIIFLAFPNKDSTLFWSVNITASSSLLFFLAGYLIYVQYLRSSHGWLLGAALLFQLLSLATYDQCFFLVALWLLTPDASSSASRRKRIAIASAAAVLCAFAIYKFLLAPRWIHMGYNKSLDLSISHFTAIYLQGLEVTFGPRFLGYVLRAVKNAFLSAPWTATAAIALPVLAPIAIAAPRSRKSAPAALYFLGAGIFVLGYLPVAVSTYQLEAINPINRLNAVPDLGLVVLLTAACQSPRLGKLSRIFPCMLASICLAAQVAFAGYWATACDYETRIQSIVQQQASQWPSGTRLLLLFSTFIAQNREPLVEDKAPVFVTSWDISGACQIWTHDESRQADVLRPYSEFFPQGLRIRPGTPVLPYDQVRVLIFDGKKGSIQKVDYRNFKPGA